MTSISSRSPLFAVGRKPHTGAFGVLQANLGLLAIALGILGLIRDSRPNSASFAWLHLHILFAAFLWLSVVAQFHRRFYAPPGMQSADLRAFARHLSRRVYLLLYGLMFLNLMLGVKQREHFQFYLACGVCALITIHLLAALCLRFLIRGGGGNGRLTYRDPASPKRQG